MTVRSVIVAVIASLLVPLLSQQASAQKQPCCQLQAEICRRYAYYNQSNCFHRCFGALQPFKAPCIRNCRAQHLSDETVCQQEFLACIAGGPCRPDSTPTRTGTRTPTPTATPPPARMPS
jgi:hypothetical protein